MTISTKGRKIQIKQGLNKDFTNDTLDVGEFGLILDKDELRIGLADGTTMIVNGGTAAESQLNSHKELIATNTTLGHVKVGTNIDITSGAISVANASIGAKGVVQLNDTLTSTSTTLALTARQGKELKDLIDNISVSSGGGITIADIPDASTTSRGLMTITQVNKLNGISSGANFVQVVDNLTSTSSSSALSAYQGKIINDKITDATTSKKGIVQLSDSTSSTSTSLAATASAVKQAYDLANTANNKIPTVSGLYQSRNTYGEKGSALGEYNKATGEYSFASGYFSEATGRASVAMGAGKAIAQYSVAIGSNAESTSDYGVALGYFAKSTANSAIALGMTTSNTTHATTMGYYNSPTRGVTSGYSQSGDALVIGGAPNSFTPSNAFRVTFTGATYGKSAFNSTGADYAEYFEWQDSNSNNDDRVGYFVTLNGEKIEIANSDSDYIIGVISANPSVIGDSYQDQWQGMYVTDEWGRIQNEYVDVKYDDIDEEGNKVTKTRQDYVHKLNPNYDTTTEYIPREQRTEWSPVGMLGKLLVRDDGTCEVNGYAKVSDGGIATKSDIGYRVIKRVDENIVQIIFK